MKKRIIFMSIGLSLFLASCAQPTEVPQEEAVQSNEPQDSVRVEADKGIQSEKEYVIEVLRNNGKIVTENDFYIKEQGLKKRVVMIKEYVKNGRLLITKFIYQEDGNGSWEPLFLMVDNHVKYGTEND